MGIRPQRIPSSDSQIAQDVFEQMEMIFQDVRKNAMQAYIKYKEYYIKKTNASKLKEADYVSILQSKADHQRTKLSLQVFRGLDHIILKKYYRPKLIWYAKLAPRRRNFFVKWGYANSKPANQYKTYQSDHSNGNQTRKMSLNMMIYTPERGSVMWRDNIW